MFRERCDTDGRNLFSTAPGEDNAEVFLDGAGILGGVSLFALGEISAGLDASVFPVGTEGVVLAGADDVAAGGAAFVAGVVS